MKNRLHTLAVFSVVALVLTGLHWSISPPNSSHGVAGAIGFTVIAWLLWLVCLAPVWIPYLVSQRAVRTRAVFFLASAVLLLTAAAALAFVYLYGDRFSHWGTMLAASVLVVAAVVQGRNGVASSKAQVGTRAS